MPTSDSRTRTLAWLLGIAGTVAALLVVAYGVLAWWTTTRVPWGTTVAGIDIGGMHRDEARQRIDGWAGEAASRPISVSIDGESTTVVPREAGLAPDTAAMWDLVPSGGLPPHHVIGWFTARTFIAPMARVDSEALEQWVDDVATDVDVAPREPHLSFAGTEAVLVDGADGRRLDREALAAAVEDAFLGDAAEVVALVERNPPSVDIEAAAEARQAAHLLVGRPPVVATEHGQGSLTRKMLARATRFEPQDGALAAVVDGAVLRDRLVKRHPDLVKPGRDAGFRIKKGKPRLIPARPGATVSAADLGREVGMAFRSYPPAGVIEVPAEPLEPALTDEAALALGITERLSSFTQQFPYAAYRVQNIGQAARYINGTVLLPGETFSFNDTLGERTVENGFTEGYVIGPGGVFQLDLGGGVSASATTTWTAAFFAGMERVETRAHSIYISRYQPGLEATVAWGVFDMQFRNDTPNGVLITASITNTSMTVEFWGTRQYDEIKAEFGPRTNIRPHSTVVSTEPGCSPQSGMDGFDIDVDRVFYVDGQEVRRETISTSYRASPTVQCRKPKPVEPDAAEESGAAPQQERIALPLH